MAICGNCGADRTRVRTIFDDKGNIRKEECASCSPGTFEPDWMRGKNAWPWEAYPGKYVKFTMPDGRTGYRSTDEWRADSEDKMLKAFAKADETPPAKIEEKRRNRRTKPLTPEEERRILARLDEKYIPLRNEANRQYNEALAQLLTTRIQ